MGDGRRLCSALIVLLALSAGSATIAFAQEMTRIDLGVAVGLSPYDLSGTGTGIAAAVRGGWQPRSWLVIEPGVGFFSYISQADIRSIYLFPELSLQGQLQLGRVRPFLGAGAGGAFDVGGEGETVATLHAAGGARVDLGADWKLSGELRVRAVRPWTGNTADFLLGVYYRVR
jgi:hypothetical protein